MFLELEHLIFCLLMNSWENVALFHAHWLSAKHFISKLTDFIA